MALAIIGLLLPLPVLAQTSSSSNYRVEEAQFGSGGEVESCSAGQYCAQSSIGSLGVGTSSSNNFDVDAGFLTSSEPYLAMAVSGSVDLGTLTTSATAYGSGTFSVRTYLSSTYSVITMSNPPTNSAAQLDAMATLAAPTPGTEQFGINLINNSSPDVGADPINQPDNTFADGQAAPGYDTLNQFKYVVGDTIARSQATAGNPAVGQTDYTISYVANISGITEAGTYTMDHVLVAVPTF